MEIEQLIIDSKKGKIQAQKGIYELYASKMLGICLRYCKNREDAKDAMQDGFVKIFTSLDKYKGESKFETWITRIMMNTAIDNFKKNFNTDSYENDHLVFTENESGEEDSYYEGNELNAEDILTCVQSLPDGYRIVFNMYAIEGLAHKDIANQLNINIGTSKSQYFKAKQLLQELISKKIRQLSE